MDLVYILSIRFVEFDQVVGSGWVAREGAAPSLTHVPVDARVAKHVPDERKTEIKNRSTEDARL